MTTSSGSWGCLGAVVMFAVLMAPVYLMFRFLVKLVRAAYGFDVDEADYAPPLRICGNCNNTVLEDDFENCPYCGRPLPPPGAVT